MRVVERLRSFGLKICFPLAIALCALLELAGWPFLVLAGLIVGALALDWKRALVSGFLGALIGWGLYFLAYWALAPDAMSIAMGLVPDFLAITLLLGAIIGLLSASTGYFAAYIIQHFVGKSGEVA